MQATLTFLGSGTSMGIPTLGCDCAVCASATPPGPYMPPPSPHNRRTRPSISLVYSGHAIVIDTGPDFHAQAIRERIRRVDAVLYTHGHADHIMGFDDLRPLSFHVQGPDGPANLPIYADDATASDLERIFHYNFNPENRYPTRARVEMHRLDPTPGASVELFGANFQRLPLTHGRLEITGYRFGSAAYLTDMSDIPPESVPLLQDLDVLILDALRREPHYSHSHLEKSIAFVNLLQPKRAFFTHMSHDIDHAAIEATLPPHIRLAYDGLQIQFEIAPSPAPALQSKPAPMNIYRNLAEIPTTLGPTVATIGNFDGVHRGHQWVIAEVVARARTLGLPSLAVTFDPHPARVLRPGASLPLITPLDQKLELLAATGIQNVAILPFTEQFSQLTARAFATEILRDTLHIQELHEGENFRFGYQAEAGIENLEALGKELGFTVRVYSPRILRGGPISSSRIRQAIASGDLSLARALLGHPFSIESTLASGRGYGTRYTVPTINLAPYAELLPANGVYVTTLTIGTGPGAETFNAVTNIGNRPTFAGEFAINPVTVESHLLNFHPIDLDETTQLKLTFLKRLRAEVRWPNPEALREQILRDVQQAKRFFNLCQAVASKPRAGYPPQA